MGRYGIEPVREPVHLVQCKRCTKLVLRACFAGHDAGCPGTPASRAPPAPPVATVAPRDTTVVRVPNAPLSSTRTGAGDGRVRAPPTPPKLIKIKKPIMGGGGGAGGSSSSSGPRAPDTVVAPSMAVMTNSRRKEVSVLEITGDNDASGKVTIVVESDAPARSNAVSEAIAAVSGGYGGGYLRSRSSGAMEDADVFAEDATAGFDDDEPRVRGGALLRSPYSHALGSEGSNRSVGGGMPMASRRWTRRNRLTGLSLSFQISDGAEAPDLASNLHDGWTYHRVRRERSSGSDLADGNSDKDSRLKKMRDGSSVDETSAMLHPQLAGRAVGGAALGMLPDAMGGGEDSTLF